MSLHCCHCLVEQQAKQIICLSANQPTQIDSYIQTTKFRLIFSTAKTRMVDPHQVFIDNGNSSSTISVTPPSNFIQMNESDTHQQPPQNQQSHQSADAKSVVSDGIDVVNKKFNENRQNVYDRQADSGGEIMCGPSARNYTSSSIQSNDLNINRNSNRNSSANVNAFVVAQNGDGNNSNSNSNNSSNSSSNSSSLTPNKFEKDIEPINVNANKVCVIVNNKQTRESNDSYSSSSSGNQSPTTQSATSINSADIDREFHSAAIRSNLVFEHPIDTTSESHSNKMDSRKVEPLRININRDPIKTKIKLGTSSAQTMSPKSSTSTANMAGHDELNDGVHDVPTPHENQQIYPKIIIKPIVKPPTEIDHHHHNHSAGSHAPSSSSSSSSSQEAIPKLKIKKIDANNSNSVLPIHSSLSNCDDITGNYQTHLLSESSPSVPK